MEKVRELSESSSGDDQTPLHISLQAPTSKRQENTKRQRKRQKDREKDKKTEKKTKRHNMEGVLLHYLIYKTKKNNGTASQIKKVS